jgi:hypothetical protein
MRTKAGAQFVTELRVGVIVADGDPPPDDQGEKVPPFSSFPRTLLVGLLAIEAGAAAIVIGYALLLVLDAAFAVQHFYDPPASERGVLTLDLPRLGAVVIPAAVLCLICALSAVEIWRTRRHGLTGRVELLTRVLMVAQPVLLCLIAEDVFLIETQYGISIPFLWTTNGSISMPWMVAVVALCVAVGLVFALWATRKLAPRLVVAYVLTAVLLLGVGALQLLALPGTRGRADIFSSVTFLQTGEAEWASVSCSAPGHCVAFGASTVFPRLSEFADVALTSDGGRTWHLSSFPAARLIKMTRLRTPDAFLVLAMVDCPSAKRCFVARADDAWPLQATELPFARSNDAGATWQILPAALPAGNDNFGSVFGGLSCTSPSTCVLVDGHAAVVTYDAGTSWHVLDQWRPSANLAEEKSGVDCPDSLHCLVWFSQEAQSPENVDPLSNQKVHFHYRTTILQTANGGASWHRFLLPGNIGLVSSLWCGDRGRCLVSAETATELFSLTAPHNQFATSADWGRTWRVSSQTEVSFSQVRCNASDNCLALGALRDQSGVLASSDGGRSWRLVLKGFFMALSCPGKGFCAASGTIMPLATGRAFLATTTNYGCSWTVSLFPIEKIRDSQPARPW